MTGGPQTYSGLTWSILETAVLLFFCFLFFIFFAHPLFFLFFFIFFAHPLFFLFFFCSPSLFCLFCLFCLFLLTLPFFLLFFLLTLSFFLFFAHPLCVGFVPLPHHQLRSRCKQSRPLFKPDFLLLIFLTILHFCLQHISFLAKISTTWITHIMQKL